jgi:hypothetical protein
MNLRSRVYARLHCRFLQQRHENSLASAPHDSIVQVRSLLVEDVPANIPRALLPEFIANLILSRSPQIG